MKTSEAVDRYLLVLDSAGYAKNTLVSYSNRLHGLVTSTDDTTLDTISSMQIQQYLADLRNPPHNVSDATLGHAHAVLSAFFGYCVKQHLIQVNPMNDVIKQRLSSSIDQDFASLNHQELNKLLDVALNGWTSTEDTSHPPDLRKYNRRVEDYLLIAFMAYAGLRVSEVCSLNADSIVDDVVHVTGKGRKQRSVPLHADILHYLSQYEKYSSGNHLFAMPRTPGKRLTANAVQQRIPRLGVRAGIIQPRVTPHVLRHTFGSLMLAADPTALIPTRDLMGHESIDTTNRYAHTRDEARRMALQSFHEQQRKS